MSLKDLGVDLTSMYAADDAFIGTNSAPVVRVEHIVDAAFAGRCGECGEACGRSLYECMDLARPEVSHE